MKLWVDDIRTPPSNEWVWAKSSNAAIEILEASTSPEIVNMHIDEMSLDHDLGGEDTSRAIVLWCCHTGHWPTTVKVHSANYVGVEWLESMIERYHPKNAYKYGTHAD